MWAAVTTITISGNWNDPGIWAGGNIADDISEEAEINNNLGTIVIQNGDNYIISDLNMNNGNTLNIDAGGSLTIGSMANPGNLTTGNSSFLNIDGDLEVWGNIVVLNTLVATVTGNLIVHGDLAMGNGANLDIQGNVVIEGDLIGGNNAVVNVDGILNISGNIDMGDNSILSGTGTINISGGCTGPPTFCNSGPLTGVATAGAGDDAIVCFNTPYLLVAVATNGSILWTSTGDGTFDSDILEDPVYTFGSGDLTLGEATLTITVTGGNIASDDMVLTVDPEASADAGSDAIVCYNTAHQLAATAMNGTLLWTTSGDGDFDDELLEDPVYTFGSGDIATGSVWLTMTATNNCNAISDNIVLSIDTEATADAGTDLLVCNSTSYMLNATATNGTILWTTDGTGTFDDVSLENPVYTFSAADTSSATITLTITVTGNCNTPTDDVILTLDHEDPLISNCPGDIISSVSGSNCDKVVTWDLPTATDNCSITSLTGTYNPGDTFPIGTTIVTYTAIDPSGNTAICSFSVIIEDNISPMFNFCPTEVIIAQFELLTQGAIVTWQDPVATDNCTSTSITSNYNSGDSFPSGTTTVVYTATDDSGNMATCEFGFEIIGNAFPIASTAIINAFAGEAVEICLDVTDPDGDDLAITDIDISTLNGEIDRTNDNGLCFTYTPFDDYEGEDIFYITICDSGLPTACIEVEVRVTVTFNLTLTVFKAFTPNNDNINDVWMIENIDNYPDNEVMVFDRWGGMIFSAKGYDNEFVVWDGRSNQSGQRIVPSGTYFYKIYRGLELPILRGFVELIQ